MSSLRIRASSVLIGILCWAAAPVAAQVTATTSLTAGSFGVYEPVFVTVHAANAGTQDLQVAMGVARLAVERQASGGSWEEVDLFEGIDALPDRVYGPDEGWTKVVANGEAWGEILLRQPSIYAVPGNYRIQLRAIAVDANGTESAHTSAWVPFSITPDAATAAVIESDGVLETYEALMLGDYGRGEIALPQVDYDVLTTIVDSGVSVGVAQFVDVLRAQELIRASATQATPAAVIQMLDDAIALCDAVDQGMYASEVGGVGAHALYTRAWARWLRAGTLQEFDAATAEYQAIPQQFPQALVAVRRIDWSVLRAILPQ